MIGAEAVFARYEEIRPRLPEAGKGGACVAVGGLADLAGRADVFVFDAYGVLNVGSLPIAGAPEAVAMLRGLGKRVFVLTNAASLNRAAMQTKFAALGFDFAPDEIVSSRDAALAALAGYRETGLWGVIADTGHLPDGLPLSRHHVLEDDPAPYAAVDAFLFLGADRWSDTRQELLRRALGRHPRPLIVGNPDLVSPREEGLFREPGWYAHAIADSCPAVIPALHGKPYPSVYDLLMARLPADQPRERILMLGDTLHTDILGARSQGWQAGLVTGHGLFAGQDVAPFIRRSGIRPDWIMPRIG